MIVKITLIEDIDFSIRYLDSLQREQSCLGPKSERKKVLLDRLEKKRAYMKELGFETVYDENTRSWWVQN
jgi:hypothetical protein